MSTQTQNPFDIQRVVLENSIYLSTTAQYLLQVHVLQGLLGIVLALQVVTLILRWRSKSFWLFRYAPSSGNSSFRFIVPNSIILFTIFYVVYGCCLQGFLVSMENYGTVGNNLHNIMLWRCLTWYPLWLAANLMTWSTFLSPILAANTYGGHPSFWSRNPLLVNTFFIIVPFIFLAAVLPYTIPLNNTFNSIYATYEVLHSLLIQASSNLKSGVPVTPSDLILMQALAYEMQTLTPVLIHYWSPAFAIYAAFIGLVGIIFTFSAIRHFRSIGNAMSTIRMRMSTKTHSSRSDYGEQMNNLADSYRALVFTSFIVAIMCTGYFTLNVILAARTEQIAKGGTFAEVVLLLPLYLWFVWGGVSTFSIFLVSLKSGSNLTGKISNSNSAVTGSNLLRTGSVSGIGTGSGTGTGSFKNPLMFSQSLSQTVDMEMDGDSFDKRNHFQLHPNGNQFDVELRPTRAEAWQEKDQPFMIV